MYRQIRQKSLVVWFRDLALEVANALTHRHL